MQVIPAVVGRQLAGHVPAVPRRAAARGGPRPGHPCGPLRAGSHLPGLDLGPIRDYPARAPSEIGCARPSYRRGEPMTRHVYLAAALVASCAAPQKPQPQLTEAT